MTYLRRRAPWRSTLHSLIHSTETRTKSARISARKGRGRHRRFFFNQHVSRRALWAPGPWRWHARPSTGRRGGAGTALDFEAHNTRARTFARRVCPVTRVAADESSGRNVYTQHYAIRASSEYGMSSRQQQIKQVSVSPSLSIYGCFAALCARLP